MKLRFIGILIFVIAALAAWFSYEKSPQETESTSLLKNENVHEDLEARSPSSAEESNTQSSSSPTTAISQNQSPSAAVVSQSRRMPDKINSASTTQLPPRSLPSWPGIQIDGHRGEKFILLQALAYEDAGLLQIDENDILARHLGYTLVTHSSPKLTYSAEFKPVVRSENNDRLGIVTGTFITRFKANDVDTITFAMDHRLTELSYDQDLKMGFYRPQENEVDLLVLLKQIENDGRTEKVNLEIVQTERKVSP